MRLNRFLAGAGLGSRRSCEELIHDGRITVNGETAVFPGPEIDPQRDRVHCDGERLRLPKRWIYLAMNKPAGIVTTRSDERGRATVDDLLGKYRGRVFAVGRLDRASEGLLLLTNHGELANRLLHPRYRQERTYLVWVRPAPDLLACKQIAQGVPLGPGERSGPARIRVLGRNGEVGRIRMSLSEGKNREVRRIFGAFGIKVLALRRVAYAGIRLEALPTGGVRALTSEEVASLLHSTGLTSTE